MNENENMVTTVNETDKKGGTLKKVLFGLGAAGLGVLAAFGVSKVISKSKSKSNSDQEIQEVVDGEYEVIDS